jgi:hypothetical protein
MSLARAAFAMAVAAALTVALAACEGVTTGTEIAKVQLQTAEGGGYAPVKLKLTTEMNPVAINFRADFSQNPSEFGKWNSYRAALSKDGSTVASRNININHPYQYQSSAKPRTGFGAAARRHGAYAVDYRY